MVQWLGLDTFTTMAWVQFLVGELRSRRPQKKKRKPLGAKLLDGGDNFPPWLGAVTWEALDGSKAWASRFPVGR